MAKGRNYVPQPIRLTEGVTVELGSFCATRNGHIDIYRGSPEALVASGICTREMIPPKDAIRSWRPAGTVGHVKKFPRFVTLQWNARGQLVAKVTVDIAEQERRRESAQSEAQRLRAQQIRYGGQSAPHDVGNSSRKPEFDAFMGAALRPGVIRHGDHAIDVRRLDNVAPYVLRFLNDRENANLTEIECQPPQRSERQHDRVRRAIRTRSFEGLDVSDMLVLLVNIISAAERVAEEQGSSQLSSLLGFSYRIASELSAKFVGRPE